MLPMCIKVLPFHGCKKPSVLFLISGREVHTGEEPLNLVEVTEGSTVTIECSVPNIHSSEIQWLRGNKPVTKNKRMDIRKTGNKSCLIIDHVTPDDQDSYTCVVTNRKGVSKTTVHLQVVPTMSEERFIQGMSDVEITEGEDAKFDVRIEGVDLEVDWYRDDELIEDAGRFIIEDPHPDSDDNLYSLTIENCCPEDAGLYKCVANCDGFEIMTSACLVVSSAELAPEDSTKLEKEVLQVAEGDRVQLDLVLKGPPRYKVQWYKDSQMIHSDGYYDIKTRGDGHILVIERTTTENAGTYKCVASSREGTVTREFYVDVRGKLNAVFREGLVFRTWRRVIFFFFFFFHCNILFLLAAKKTKAKEPSFTSPLQPTEVTEGSTIRLECVVTGEPVSDIEWYKENKRLTKNSRTNIEMKGDKACLTIKGAGAEDVGGYRCVAINQVGTAQSVADVNIRRPTVAPKFEERLKNTDIREGERVTLVIKVSGSPDLTWYKDGKILSINDRFTVECLDKEKGNYALHIDDVKCSDSGRYKCVAKNPAGETFCSASLLVNEKLFGPEFGELTPTLNVNEGDDLILEIPLSGKPLPKVTWYKDNVLLRSYARCKIQKVGDICKLTVKQGTSQDSGVYKVVAKSSAGSATKEVHVNVTGWISFYSLNKNSRSL